MFICVFFALRAAAMTAMMMTTATPAISKVSVETPVPGVGATVGLGATVDVGAVVGGVVGVVVGAGVIAAAAGPTAR